MRPEAWRAGGGYDKVKVSGEGHLNQNSDREEGEKLDMRALWGMHLTGCDWVRMTKWTSG